MKQIQKIHYIVMASAVLFFVVIGVRLMQGSHAATVNATTSSGNWSNPSIWSLGRVPEAADAAVISANNTVTYDVRSSQVAGMTVAATAQLTFSSSISTTLLTTQNVIVMGQLHMKPANTGVIQILRFIGVNEAAFVGGGTTPIATDVGLWVIQAGKLDIVGTEKTGWTNASSAITKGSASVAVATSPINWQAKDEVVISPTEAPSVGSASWLGFDEAQLTSTVGARTLALSSGAKYSHPVVDTTMTAELMNLTRNVQIEGTASGHAHIFIDSTLPQIIKYAAIRYMGPRTFQESTKYTDPVLGRYGLHFHMAGDGSRGSIVEGTVVRDTTSHAYVAHMSHGVTFSDTVSYNTVEDAYWWDGSPDTRTDGPETYDTVYDHAMAAKVTPIPDFRGNRLTGFALQQGLRNSVRDSVAVGVQGGDQAAGFNWGETSGSSVDSGVWNFSSGNVSHNNKANGLFIWQNNQNNHSLNNVTAYHNARFGIEYGAYGNGYRLSNGTLYGNKLGAIWLQAVSNIYRHNVFENMTLDGAGQSPQIILAMDHNFDGTIVPTYFENSCLLGAPIGINFSSEGRTKPDIIALVDSTLAVDKPFQFDATIAPGTAAQTQNGATAIKIAPNGSSSSIPAFKYVDDTTFPEVFVASPLGGSTVSGQVVITPSVSDNRAVTRTEVYIDGGLKASSAQAPFAYTWDTANLVGTHTIQYKAFDAAANFRVSEIVTVFVGDSGEAVSADINKDGAINAVDVSILLKHFGENYPLADLSANGTVDTADLTILRGQWTW